MENIPSYSLPSGYSFQFYRPDSDDKLNWTRITQAAGEFKTIDDGLKMFDKYYLSASPLAELYLLPERLFFLVDPQGKYIGTTTAAAELINGEEQGSLQWVSIIPEYQGKKLAKPMVTNALRMIAKKYSRCHLASQTTSWRAINMYADLGFQPDLTTTNSEKAWKELERVCHRNFVSSTSF